MRPLPFLLAVLLAFAPGGAAAQSTAKKDAPKLAAASVEALDALLARAPVEAKPWRELLRSVLAVDGDAQALEDALERVVKDGNGSEKALAARTGLAWILHADGKLQAALDHVELLVAARTPAGAKEPAGVAPALLLHRAHLCDALGRIDAAIEAYALARSATADAATLQHVDLRVALLEHDRDAGAPKTAGGGGGRASGAVMVSAVAAVPLSSLTSAVSITSTSSVPGVSASSTDAEPAPSADLAAEPADASALYRLASAKSGERDFQNRAAVVLALLGRPAEATRLYTSAGEATDLFKQEIRLAEWSLAASEPKAAQEHAWKARGAAALKRDRGYALTVLVEAHRADKSLAKLAERFAAEPTLDEESRSVWIDLLRELARVDEAMALFQSAHQGAFTPEMRRELLDLCREAGREDELVATYRQLITDEPERLEWREGLARSFLERGKREEAQAIWQAFVDARTGIPERLQAAQAARAQGLDDFARRTAELCLAGGSELADAGRLEARLFLSELEQARGRTDAALAELARFDAEAPPASPERVRLAEAFERLGDKQRAVDVLEALRTARGADASEEDLEMRLAWLCSEVGRDELALERWTSLWRRVTSIPRRRQVEDRLMAVAARLGKLSDIAVDLEQKLAAGKADDREAGLLVRLYGKVGDPVSAAEVLEEHLKSKGKGDADVLAEKARIYLAGKDYYRYEKTVRKLIVLDPENRPDHLRQLAMSSLERGKPMEARAILADLARTESPGDAAEFEAGVLALAGLNDDAARTYRRGLAANPDRIDGWLLLGNALKALNKTEQATGLFQVIADDADKDDLFTVAIDGVLNMRAKEPIVRWARRVTLERLARRHDKLYLYQLVADLSEELEDVPAILRALETSLAIAGEQRTSLLRQMMDTARGKQSNSFVVVNGVVQQRSAGGMDEQRLAYGRRLIGLGDAVPPGVYLELGETFLKSGEVSNAAKTFSMARDVPDWSAFQRQIATSFENAQYVESALAVYERLMASQAAEPSLLLKTAELNEQLGRDERAAELYARALGGLYAQVPLEVSATAAAKPDEDADAWAPKNVGEFERYGPPLENGLFGASSAAELRAFFDAQRAELDRDLAAWDALPRAKEKKPAEAPRLVQRAALLRRIGLRAGWSDAILEADATVARRFPAAADLVETMARERIDYGATGAAERIVAESALPPAERAGVLARLGRGDGADESQRALAPSDLVARLVPLLLEGDRAKLGLALRAAQLGAPKKEDLAFVQVLVSAAVFAGDAPSVDALTGYALRTIVAHGSGWEDTQKVIPLLERARGVLAPAAFDVLLDSFVQLVAADEKKLQQFQYVLSQLSESRGRPLLSADAVEKRLSECLPDRYYMLDSLLGLVPADARLGLLSPLWSKVPAAQRAYVALSFLSNENEAPAPAFADFLVEAYVTGLEGVDEPVMLTYSLQQIVTNSKLAPDVVRRLVAESVKRWPDDSAFQALDAAAIAKGGDAAASLARVEKLLPALSKADEEREWVVSNALRALVNALGKEHAGELLALVDAYEGSAALEDGPGADRIGELRSSVFELLGDRAKKRASLEARLEKKPKDARLLRELADEAGGSGDPARQRAFLERLADTDKKPATREQLVSYWKRRGHPLNALAARDSAQKKAKPAAAPEDVKKLEPATLLAVKKALDAGRVEDARALYRRTWREFHRESPYGRIYRSRGFGQADPAWPEDATPKDGAARVVKDGLSVYALEEPPKEEAQKRTAYDVLVELPFGGDELARQARSLDASALQGSRALLRGVMHAEVKRLGEREAVDAWTKSVRGGGANTLERALLLAWFEEHAAELTSDHRETLAGLAGAVHPLDASQLRALARLHVKLGLTARAATIYRWCGALSSGRRWFYGNDASISARDLLDEVARELRGDELAAVVESILSAARPATGPGNEDEAEDFAALELATWTKVLGPANALQRSRATIDRALDPKRGLSRAPALAIARVLSATGDTERALRALELGLCRLDAEDVVLGPGQSYRAQWLLQARPIGWDDARTLFPRDATPEWCERAARAAIAWNASGRLQDGVATTLLLAAVQRLHVQGDAPRASAVLAELVQLPCAVGPRLAVLDVARALGRESEARAIEDELVRREALPPHRALAAAERVRAEQGAAAGLAWLEGAARWTLSRPILERLAAWATEANDAERIARWSNATAAAEAAAKDVGLTW
ncbi:MAG: hypothetical protein IPJ77_00640 [Planctomycetes bacterium]|nr:hypothetical protein [Planctomycetota bacterium]